MTIVTLGIDLGKNLNSVVGLDAEDRVVLRRRVRRVTLAKLADKLQPCTVAMEACCGAHHVSRLFEVDTLAASSWRCIGSVDQCGVRGCLDNTALALPGSVWTAPSS